MSKDRSSIETGELQPAREEVKPEALELIVRFIEELGPDGLNAAQSILHAERDLRTIASIEPSKFIHALESADQLTPIRASLATFIEQAEKMTMPSAVTNSLGKTAIDHFPTQNEKRRPPGRRFFWRRGGDSNSR